MPRLLSLVTEVFRDLWRAWREKKYKKAVKSKGTPNSSQSAPASAGKLRRKTRSDSVSLGNISADSSPRSAAGSASASALRSRRLIQEAKRDIAEMEAFRLLADDIDADMLSMGSKTDDGDDDLAKSAARGPQLFEPALSPSLSNLGNGGGSIKGEAGSHPRLKPVRKKPRSV